MIELRYPNEENSRLFRNNIIDNLFYELLYTGEDKANNKKFGALSYILNNYPISLAKGGKNFVQYNDTSYFEHVLNATFIAAKFLELKYNDEQIKAYSELGYLRLFLCAMVVHDMNKLINVPPDGKSYYSGLINNKQTLIKIVSYNMSQEPIYKNSDEWISDLIFLILAVEDGTRSFATNIETKINKPILMQLSQILHIGDKYSSILSRKNFDSDEFVCNLNKEIISVIGNERIPKIHKINLNYIPQSILYIKTRDEIKKAIKSSKSIEIFLSSHNWFIIFDYDYKLRERSVQEEIISLTQNRLQKKNSDVERKRLASDKIKSLKFRNNSINVSFLQEGFSSPDTIRECVTYWTKTNPNSFIHLEGQQYIARNAEKLRPVLKKMDADLDLNRGTKLKIQLSEDERNYFIELWMLLLIKNEVEKRKGERESSGFSVATIGLDEGNLTSITRKSLETMWNAFSTLEGKSEEEKEQIINDISENISASAKSFSGINARDPYIEAFQNVFPIDKAENTEISFNREDKCVQCGMRGKESFEDSRVFGIKATSGSGIKLSSLNDSQKFKGKICDLCIEENYLRKNKYGQVSGSWVFQINPFKALPDFDYSRILDGEFIYDENGTMKIKIGQATHSLIGNSHIITFIEKTSLGGSSKVDKSRSLLKTFDILKTSLKLINKFGIKIAISPLFSTDMISGVTFYWENAPSWVQNIKLHKLHLDEIKEAMESIELIDSLSHLGGNDKNSFLKEMIMKVSRNPLYLFNILYDKSFNGKSEKDQKKKKFLHDEEIKGLLEKIEKDVLVKKEMGEMKMMDEVVGKACELFDVLKFVKKDIVESNNDRTWIIRESFRIEEKLQGSLKNITDDDIIGAIAGGIDTVLRREKTFQNFAGQKKENIADAAISYASAFHNFYKTITKECQIDTELRKIFINQFGLSFYIMIMERINNQYKTDIKEKFEESKGVKNE